MGKSWLIGTLLVIVLALTVSISGTALAEGPTLPSQEME
jgi:hypothetical protein